MGGSLTREVSCTDFGAEGNLRPRSEIEIPGSLHKKRSHFHQPFELFVHFHRPNGVSDFSSVRGSPLKALRKARSRCLDQFAVFELALRKRGRTWLWRVCTTEGAVVMQGSKSSRPAAKYQADRALFLLLLSAPYRSIQLSAPRSPEETI
jgi:hypothetical protein